MTHQWPALESNPEIFTDYLRKVGLPENYIISEVYGFDEELLQMLPNPIYAVLVAFQDGNNKEEDHSLEENAKLVPFYMKQEGQLDNACGTIAAVHAIGNNLSNVQLLQGSMLEEFYLKAMGCTASEVAQVLQNSEEFHEQHQEVAAQGASNPNGMGAHFSAFVINKNKQLIELDGCRKGPHIVAENQDDVLRGAITEIQRRLSNNAITSNINMMVLAYDSYNY